MESLPYLRRKSRARRSSYAFSHREGYADLITRGTILRRSPGVDSDTLADHSVPCDEELAPSIKESPWYQRNLSLLGKKRHQHQGKVSSEDVRPPSAVSSSLTMEGQFSFTKNEAPSMNWPSGSFHKELPGKQARPYSSVNLPPIKGKPSSLAGSWMPFSESRPLPSGQSSLKNQPASLGKMSFWKMSLLSQRSWPCIWQKESHPHKKGRPPLPQSQPIQVYTATQ